MQGNKLVQLAPRRFSDGDIPEAPNFSLTITSETIQKLCLAQKILPQLELERNIDSMIKEAVMEAQEVGHQTSILRI